MGSCRGEAAYITSCVCILQARLEAVKEECERRIAALRENDKNGKRNTAPFLASITTIL